MKEDLAPPSPDGSSPAGLEASPPPALATPEPSSSPALPDPPADPLIEAFDDICGRLAGFDDRLDSEFIDGYLTAIAASWRQMTLDEVLQPLCADTYGRAFADPEDEMRARAALQSRLGSIRGELDPYDLGEEPDTLRLAPLMRVWDDEIRRELVEAGHLDETDAAQLQTGAVWAQGFFAAVRDFPAEWPDPKARNKDLPWFARAFETIAALMLDPAGREFRAFVASSWGGSTPTRDEVVDEALYAVQDLRLLWLDHPPRRPPRQVQPAPGRNDPCSCGSGRKYKKCHGA